MKRSQIILLAVFLVLTGIIYIALSNNKKDVKKELKPEDMTVYLPIREVKNELRVVGLESYGQVTPNSEINISFEVQGKLQKGAVLMKPGMRFKQGQLLYTLNKSDIDFAMKARKSALSTLIVASLPDIELDFPSERNKWVKFLNGLNPDLNQLPDYPKINSEKEALFITGRNILTEYYSLKSQEEQLKKYAYYAPFSGTVISVNAEPGAIASPGMMIARIAKTGEFEVRIPISLDDLAKYKSENSATFKNSANEVVGTGRILRISDVVNQQTQSADVYYSIQPAVGFTIYNGMFLTASIEGEKQKSTMTIPRAAYVRGNVTLLVGDKLVRKKVLQSGVKPDSVLVTGLENGQLVLLEDVEKIDPKKKYIGIKR